MRLQLSAPCWYADCSWCALCCRRYCCRYLPHKLDPLHLKRSTQTYAPATYRGHQASPHSWPEVGLVREFQVRPAAAAYSGCVTMHQLNFLMLRLCNTQQICQVALDAVHLVWISCAYKSVGCLL
jgi:hypothetical protein